MNPSTLWERVPLLVQPIRLTLNTVKPLLAPQLTPTTRSLEGSLTSTVALLLELIDTKYLDLNTNEKE